MEAYVTLEEAARLESIEYESMKKRVQRSEKYITKTVKDGTVGRDSVYVRLDSLSRKAQEAYNQMQELCSTVEADQEQIREEPWYVTVDPEWYMETYPENYYKAVELGNVIRQFLDYDENNRSRYAEEFAQKYLGKGQRTLYRYMKAYVEASAWAIKKGKEDNKNYDYYKVFSLCRKPKQADMFPSFTPEVKQLIKNIWFNKEFATNRGTREMLYDKLKQMAALNKWEKIPSYQ